MPFPNQHAAVVIAASKFDQKSFRTINIGNKDSGITAIVGRKKGEKTTSVHSYRFDKKKFSADQARKWLKDHDIKPIEFEAASEKSCEVESDFNEMPDNLEYKTFELNIIETKEDEDLGVFRGAMATEHKDRGNDIIAPDAFDNTLKRYKRAKRDIKLFYQHDRSELPIGIIPIKSVEKDGKNWNVKGELNLSTQKGQEVYSLLKQGALSDLSIGFSIIDQDIKNNTRIIKELELWEVSIVSEPMNPKAIINEVKADDGEIKEKFCIEEVEHIKTREEFNEILSKSGIFSRSACEFLASCFLPKNPEIDQSKSVIDSEDELKTKDHEADEINEELENAELGKSIDDQVIIHKLDELLSQINLIKDDYNDTRNNCRKA